MADDLVASGDGIRCPACGGATGVIETRMNRGSLRRRRGCLADGCNGRLTTVEMVAPKFSKRLDTTELVAMPAPRAVEVEIVPRQLMNALRDLLAAHGSESHIEEHW